MKLKFYCAERCKWTATEGFCPRHEGRSAIGWPENIKDYTPKPREAKDMTCESCGKGFQAKRAKKYCSIACRRRAEREADKREWSAA